MIIFAQFTANFVITNYSILMFQKSGSSLDPSVSAVLLASMYIVGSLLTTYLADLLGRKKLNILSLIGSAIGLFSFALYQYLRLNGFNLSSFNWVPVLSLSFVILISTAGIMPLSIICSAENLPTKVCSLTCDFVILLNCLENINILLTRQCQTNVNFFQFYS